MNNNIVTYLKMKEILQFLWGKIKGNFVEHWGDLKYTTGHKYENLLNYDNIIDGKWFPNENDGTISDNPNWSVYHVPVSRNEEYTLLRRFSDSGRFVFFNAQRGVEQVVELNRNNLVNGWHRNYIRVPDNANISYMAFCFQTYSSGVNSRGRIMLLKESNVREELDFIPYLPGEKVIIDGDKVAINFNNSSTGLASSNLVNAVKELDDRITNVGTGGSVTSVNGQQGVVNLNGTHINALMGGSTKPVQEHLQKLNSDLTIAFDNITRVRNDLTNTTNNHNGRITALERKVPTVQVGDIIQTFKNSGDSYTVGGVTYLYIGKTRTVQSATYPELPSALGITGTVSAFQLPVMNDVNVIFDNGRNTSRKHYIVAKIG